MFQKNNFFISIYLNKYEFEFVIFSLSLASYESTRNASFMARGLANLEPKEKSQTTEQQRSAQMLIINHHVLKKPRPLDVTVKHLQLPQPLSTSVLRLF
jgi:hypothetical protein